MNYDQIKALYNRAVTLSHRLYVVITTEYGTDTFEVDELTEHGTLLCHKHWQFADIHFRKGVPSHIVPWYGPLSMRSYPVLSLSLALSQKKAYEE